MLTLNLRFVSSFAWYYGIKSIPRGISYIISSFLYPIVFLFLIVIFSEGKFLAFGVIGGFIAIVATNSIYSSSDAAFQRIQLKLQDLLVATSITSIDYMFAMALSYLATSLPGIGIYAVIAVMLHLFTAYNALAFTGILLLLLIATLSIAFIIAGMTKHLRNIWGISAITNVLLTMVAPSFYPYTILPKAALYALMVSPVTPAAILSQGLFGIAPKMPYILPLFIIETAVYFAVALKFTHWREK